jgi:signal transduction histidine kinase
MNELIDGLMMVTRVSREAVRPRRVDFSAAAAEIVGDMRRAEPARHVEVTIEPGMHAHGDLTLLRTLLQNLIGNAWKYTRKVGEARIWVTRDAQAPNGFCVSDNGVGFDPRYAQRLFTPFQRLHSASEYEGTGVGLATARRIVERHGGSIRAESLPDAGASFHFTLPGQA